MEQHLNLIISNISEAVSQEVLQELLEKHINPDIKITIIDSTNIHTGTIEPKIISP